MYKQNLVLNNEQGLICHKRQLTNQHFPLCFINFFIPPTKKACGFLLFQSHETSSTSNSD